MNRYTPIKYVRSRFHGKCPINFSLALFIFLMFVQQIKLKKKTTTLNPKGAHAITIKAVLHNRERYRARAKGA